MSTFNQLGGYEHGEVTVVAPHVCEWTGREILGEVRLPHQCDEWTIGYGPKASVLVHIDALIADLQSARSEVEAWEQ